jgi:glucuronokinase
MQRFASLAEQGRQAILDGDHAALASLIDQNFDTRRSIYSLPSWQIQMVEIARACGASAKFAGSGGAIIGTYQNEAMYAALREKLAQSGSILLKPRITPA